MCLRMTLWSMSPLILVLDLSRFITCHLSLGSSLVFWNIMLLSQSQELAPETLSGIESSPLAPYLIICMPTLESSFSNIMPSYCWVLSEIILPHHICLWTSPCHFRHVNEETLRAMNHLLTGTQPLSLWLSKSDSPSDMTHLFQWWPLQDHYFPFGR